MKTRNALERFELCPEESKQGLKWRLHSFQRRPRFRLLIFEFMFIFDTNGWYRCNFTSFCFLRQKCQVRNYWKICKFVHTSDDGVFLWLFQWSEALWQLLFTTFILGMLVQYITKACLFKYTENVTTKKKKKKKKKKWKFSDKKKNLVFSYFCSKQRLWVLVRTASTRRF